MAVHDAYARITPYEIAFPSLDAARSTLAQMRAEAAAAGLALDDPAQVLGLDATREAAESLGSPGGDSEEAHSLALLLGHALRFWSDGETVALISAATLRRVVADPLSSSPPSSERASAGYVQLPHRMVWLVSEDSPTPESVDGFFWMLTEHPGRLWALFAVGMRGDRAGFSVIPLPPVELDGELPNELIHADPQSAAAALPGAEIEGLVTLRSTTDAARLALGAVFALWTTPAPERHAASPSPADETTPARGAPPRSALPYLRITG
jgi:hypothetical protein